MQFVTGYSISSSQPCEVEQNDQNYEKGDLNEYSDSKGWPLKKWKNKCLNVWWHLVCLLQVIQTWHRYAAIHAYKKSQTLHMVEEARQHLNTCRYLTPCRYISHHNACRYLTHCRYMSHHNACRYLTPCRYMSHHNACRYLTYCRYISPQIL